MCVVRYQVPIADVVRSIKISTLDASRIIELNFVRRDDGLIRFSNRQLIDSQLKPNT